MVVEADESDAASVGDAGHELAVGGQLGLAPPHGFGHLAAQPGHAAHRPVETWSSNSDERDSAGFCSLRRLQLMSLCVVGLVATCHNLSTSLYTQAGQLPRGLGREEGRGAAACNVITIITS